MNPTILSMNTPLNIGSTSAGAVRSTASKAQTGAKRMTLMPRYATYMSNTRARRTMMKLMAGLLIAARVGEKQRQAVFLKAPQESLVALDQGTHQITNREHALDAAFECHGQVPDAFFVHELDALRDPRVRAHGIHAGGHHLTHRRRARVL